MAQLTDQTYHHHVYLYNLNHEIILPGSIEGDTDDSEKLFQEFSTWYPATVVTFYISVRKVSKTGFSARRTYHDNHVRHTN